MHFPEQKGVTGINFFDDIEFMEEKKEWHFFFRPHSPTPKGERNNGKTKERIKLNVWIRIAFLSPVFYVIIWEKKVWTWWMVEWLNLFEFQPLLGFFDLMVAVHLQKSDGKENQNIFSPCNGRERFSSE